MEDVLDLYHRPYDPRFPLICMDESNKQLVGEVQPPIPAAPGRALLVDHEYVRQGVAEIFLEVEPLAGRRHVAVTEQRTRKDWARFIQSMLDERYPAAEKVCLVMDISTPTIWPRSTRPSRPKRRTAWPAVSKSTIRPNTAAGSTSPRSNSVL